MTGMYKGVIGKNLSENLLRRTMHGFWLGIARYSEMTVESSIINDLV